MRPWYSQDGQEIYFHTQIGKRHSLVRYHRVTRTIIPSPNDKLAHPRGFTMPQEKAILAHSIAVGVRECGNSL